MSACATTPERLCLIVDDDADTCWALERVLWRSGLRSEHAADARSAIERVQRVRYALALLDAKLPDTDGLVLAERIREIQPGLPMILISGYFYRNDTAVCQAQARGLIVDFIGKPFLHEDLLGAVKRALGCGAESSPAGIDTRERIPENSSTVRRAAANPQKTGPGKSAGAVAGMAGELPRGRRAVPTRGLNQEGE